jgi:putative oxidoreductase
LLFGGDGGGSVLADVGLMLLRGFFGLTLALTHGLGKVRNPSGIIEGARAMGFPAPTLFGWAAGLAEFAGGLLLALGLFTRPSAFLVACTMGVAAFVRHARDPFGVKELALVYLLIALCFLLTGSGRLGLDALLRHLFGRRSRDPAGFPVAVD